VGGSRTIGEEVFRGKRKSRNAEPLLVQTPHFPYHSKSGAFKALPLSTRRGLRRADLLAEAFPPHIEHHHGRPQSYNPPEWEFRDAFKARGPSETALKKSRGGSRLFSIPPPLILTETPKQVLGVYEPLRGRAWVCWGLVVGKTGARQCLPLRERRFPWPWPGIRALREPEYRHWLMSLVWLGHPWHLEVLYGAEGYKAL
jgi:hypothetical protein